MTNLQGKIILIIVSLLFCFLSGEIFIRIFARSDLDGNIFFNNVQLKPYHLPIKETERKIQTYLKNENQSRLIFDKAIGWIPQRSFISNDTMYIYSKNGDRISILSDTVTSQKAIKILLFGDSYLHGDEVKYEITIGSFLEQIFEKKNLKVKVYNFAVSGYGIDQAYLRWEKVKPKYKADIVIFGLQFENVKRNLNILRPLYSPITQIPFSKSRFYIKDTKLSFIDNPSNSVNDITKFISDIFTCDIHKHEIFLGQNNYENNFFYNSRFLSFINSASSIIFNEYNYYKPDTESFKLTHYILNKFKESVRNEGGAFLILHLPVKENFYLSNFLFNQVFYNQKLIYEPMFNSIKNDFKMIETFEHLSNWRDDNDIDELFLERHYSQAANKLIAERIFEFLNLNCKNILEN